MNNRSVAIVFGLAVSVLFGAGVTHAHAGWGWGYEVTITNLTKGQIISPPLVISHKGSFQLFTLGDPASPELAALAEDGMTGPLEGLLEDDHAVHDYAAGDGPIFPGESVTVEVGSRGASSYITAVGMLVSTNDAFFAVQRFRPNPKGSRSAHAYAYDAGSEVNSESCDFIPGPPCGNPGVHDTEGAEEYVYIHAGIQGAGDLDPAEFDWNNPVAKITLRPTH